MVNDPAALPSVPGVLPAAASVAPFARWLLAHRQARGLTQAQLAALLDTTETTVLRWEKGYSYPRGMARAALVRLLGGPLPPP